MRTLPDKWPARTRNSDCLTKKNGLKITRNTEFSVSQIHSISINIACLNVRSQLCIVHLVFHNFALGSIVKAQIDDEIL